MIIYEIHIVIPRIEFLTTIISKIPSQSESRNHSEQKTDVSPAPPPPPGIPAPAESQSEDMFLYFPGFGSTDVTDAYTGVRSDGSMQKQGSLIINLNLGEVRRGGLEKREQFIADVIGCEVGKFGCNLTKKRGDDVGIFLGSWFFFIIHSNRGPGVQMIGIFLC